MRSVLALALLGLVAAFAVSGSSATESVNRKLMTIGPDDIAAVAAVGEAGLHAHLSASYAAKKIAKAKAKEARAMYKADKKVADAIEDAMKHKMKYEGSPKAVKYAIKDAEDIAEAIADAKEIKIKAKMHSAKIVAKSMAKFATTNIMYGGKAALAVGNAALNDVATFAPLLAPLAPAVLPQLASGLAAGPAGIQSAIGGLAQAIGSTLVGNIGLDGPDLLANRVANILPPNLLDSLPSEIDIDVPAGLLGGGDGGSPLDSIIANMPPQVLDLAVNVLGGGNPSAPPGVNFPTVTPGGDILIPGDAIRAILNGVMNVMGQGGNNGGLGLNIDLPRLPAGGLPFPLQQLGNLLGVLPKPDLMDVFKLLPRPPLMGLLGNLPLGLQL